jgi:hypothetical protein
VGGAVRDWQLAAHLERLEVRLLGLCSRNSATKFSNAVNLRTSAGGMPTRLTIPPGSNFGSTWRSVGSIWPAALHSATNFQLQRGHPEAAPVKALGRSPQAYRPVPGVVCAQLRSGVLVSSARVRPAWSFALLTSGPDRTLPLRFDDGL